MICTLAHILLSHPRFSSQHSLYYFRYLGMLVCDMQTCLYSLEHGIPLIAFSQDRCLTLFDHPLVDSLHTTYNEPKVGS